MPTWSELELMFVNSDIDLRYEDFVLLGGVPQHVFQRALGVSAHDLNEAINQTEVTELFIFSIETVDSQQR